jgi:hypothetical protein
LTTSSDAIKISSSDFHRTDYRLDRKEVGRRGEKGREEHIALGARRRTQTKCPELGELKTGGTPENQISFPYKPV